MNNSTNEIEKRFHYFLEKEKGRSANTVSAYMIDIRLFREFLDTTQNPPTWIEITDNHIRDFMIHKDKISPTRRHRIISSLKAWFSFLITVQRFSMTDPTLGIQKPKIPERLPRYLESHELARLLDAAWKHSRQTERLRNWALCAVLYGTGLRISENLSLTLEVGKSLRYQDGEVVAVQVIGKGNKERVVPLSTTAQRALTQWLTFRKKYGAPGTAAVWVNTSGRSAGKPLSVRAADKIIRKAARDAGLGTLSAHKLRHSFAMGLRNNGRQLDEIQQFLGHKSVATTQIYARASEQILKEAITHLPDILDISRQ